MGQGESKFLSQQKQLGREFMVDSRVKQQNLTYLTNRQSQKQFLLREIVHTAQPEYLDMIKKLEQCKLINSPFITKLQRLEYHKEENLCSNYYRIYSLWEYPRKTLAEEITYRALLKQPFQSVEIRSFIVQIADAMSIFEQNNKPHECLTTKSILMAADNCIKVVDVLALPSHPNLQIVYQKRSTKNAYLSPQHCKIIASGEFNQSISNPFKDDVFIAGMILLQCALLERQDDCYAHNWEGINWDKIHEKLWSVEGRYGSELRGVIEQMLQENAERRIGWQGVINRLQPRPSLRPIQIKTAQIGQSFIRQSVQSHIPLRVSVPPPLIVTETVRRDPRNNFSFSYANSQSPVHIPARVERVSYTQGPVIRVTQPTSIIRRIVPQTVYNQLPPMHPNLIFASNNVRPIPIETSMSSKFTPIAISATKPKPQTIPTAVPLNHNGFITTVNNQFKINTPTLQEVNPPLPPEIKNFSLHIADPIYSIDQYAEGKRYEGYKVNGKKEGEGKFYLDNKLCFDGHWKDDLMEGQGKLYYQSGVLAYDGNFERDRFHGFGKLYNQAPQQSAQAYNYQNFEDIEQYWVSYEGCFQNDLKEGKGELYLTNGQHFQGNFHIDFVEGEGVYTTKQGKKIHGIWHQNKLQKILE